MSVDIKKITTENRNINTLHIDQASTIEMVKMMNEQDKTVAWAVEEALDDIAKVIDVVYETFTKGGRLIYMGAGTSGRIGIMDAVEVPPTFGTDYQMVQCMMAGGDSAFVKAKEGAEDSRTGGMEDLKNINLNEKDVLIGIAASGRTPYVLGGIEYAKSINVKTCCITTSIDSVLEKSVDYPIVAYTGAEAITGSTRLKSGTAQKMICNMISTCAMIKMGKVYQNLMIDVKATNEKLIARSYNIVASICECDLETAKELINKYGTVKKVIFSYTTGCENIEVINKYLSENLDNIQKAIKAYNEKEN